MTKHQIATYKTLKIDISDATLSDVAVMLIFDHLSQGHLNWENESLRVALLALRKRQTTRTLLPEQRSAFAKYYAECWWYTRQNIHLVSNIERRSADYHLDHMFSIYDGFAQNIDSRIIGSHINLRVIPAKENLQKQRNSCITLEDLLYEYTQLEHRNTANL